MTKRLTILLFIWIALMPAQTVQAVRVQSLCDVRGVRSNQLIGYGLVVGLQGTGDTQLARFTIQSTAAMLRRLGATIDPNVIQTRNAAAVMVTATLPAFANPGSRIDVTVSSMGNARSMVGGTLLQTPLYGADQRVYAVAQGPLITGGFSAQGRTGSSIQQNHTTVGRVPQGGIVEQRVRQTGLSNEALVLALREPSFVTAQRIVEAINAQFQAVIATAEDSGTIRVHVPELYKKDPVRLLAMVQVLEVDPDHPARIVIDERTGTVVLGSDVRISEVAIAQGGLTVEVFEQPIVSQPGAFAGGDTAIVDSSDVSVELRGGRLHHVPKTASLQDVVAALNALGAKPRNLLPILQALRTSGALQAEIEVQ